MGKFKKDDKVICINSYNSSRVVKGGYYIIKDLDCDGDVHVEGISGILYAYRFELATIPHVHCDLIKEWADGAIIQFRNTLTGRWEDTVINKPRWTNLGEYRVKPTLSGQKEKLLAKIAELTAQMKELD